MSLEAGRHRAVFARGHRALVESVDASTGERAWIVRGADGAERSRLRSVAEPPPFMPSVEFTRAGRQGFRAAIVRPRDFDASKRYPVLVSVYGGPVFSTVYATPRSYVLDQLTADQGFVVVSLDGRGTPGRGRAWVRAIRGDLVGPALADQVEGLLALGKRYPELDMSRVGIHGWSFGGYMAAMAVLRRPDVFRAAMAGAPVVDWRDYDTFYTERYLGLPETDPGAYETSSVLTGAERLDRPLLIVHGVADDNVYFMHTLKLCAALNEAGRPYELMPLLDMTHMISSPVADRRVHERTLRFFLRELGGPKPGARADANATGRP
jgi:dipeptidyl-peptidase-4